jgi:hypothetical protein
MSLRSQLGRYRSWPNNLNMTIDEPLALAEEQTNKLRRIYFKSHAQAWDGPALLRDAVSKHGGIQLSREKRIALSYPINMLMWGELAAWIVSAELTERLEDPDARMAASSQVFDEARHFYVLRDYLAMLHVPQPQLDPYFAAGARLLLDSKDLTLKLMSMQLLAEGTAQAIFQFLGESEIEPVLTEILPYIERDEARHVGLGILHLPDRLAKLTPRQARKLAKKTASIGDLFGVTQFRYREHYYALGADPQDLFRRADRILHNLSSKLGKVPGTDEPYFRTMDPHSPHYQAQLDFFMPRQGQEPHRYRVLLERVIEAYAKVLPN